MFRFFLPVFLSIGASAQTTQVDVSSLAADILRDVAQARKSIAGQDRKAALGGVERAYGNAQRIEQVMKPQGSRLLVPVYGDVETTTVYRPVKPGKGRTDVANRMKKDTNVREVSREVTESSLDVKAAADRLDAARAALGNGDLVRADAELAGVQKAVAARTTGDWMPLLRAKDNLDLARSRVLEGKYKDARMPLLSAAQALEDYRKTSPGPHAIDAGYMIGQMRNYAAEIASRHGDALDRIGEWSGKVSQWNNEMTQ